MSGADTDRDLLLRWLAGDPTAGSRLVQRHFDLVYRFFVTKVDGQLDDLVQQTFLACVKAATRYDPERGSFRAFVLGIARNELLAHRRKHGRESRAMQRKADAPVAPVTSPSAPLVHRQELRLLLAGLRQLPTDMQVAVELFYWEDLPLAEVADIVGIPEGTVKSRLSRGRALLREAILAQDAPQPLLRSTADNFERWAAALRDAMDRLERKSSFP